MIWKCGLDLEAVVKIQRGWWKLVAGEIFDVHGFDHAVFLGIEWVPCIFFQ